MSGVGTAGLRTGTAGSKARGIAFSYFRSWRSGSKRRPPAGIAERSEARPRTPGSRLRLSRPHGAASSNRVAHWRAMRSWSPRVHETHDPGVVPNLGVEPGSHRWGSFQVLRVSGGTPSDHRPDQQHEDRYAGPDDRHAAHEVLIHKEGMAAIDA